MICSFNCLVLVNCFSISATIRFCSDSGGSGITKRSRLYLGKPSLPAPVVEEKNELLKVGR